MHHRTSRKSQNNAMISFAFFCFFGFLLTSAQAETMRCEFATRHAPDFSASFTIEGSGSQRELTLTVTDKGATQELKASGELRDMTFFSRSIDNIIVMINMRGDGSYLGNLVVLNPEALQAFAGFAATLDAQVMPDKFIPGYPLHRTKEESQGKLTETIYANRGAPQDFKIQFEQESASAPRLLTEIDINNRLCNYQR